MDYQALGLGEAASVVTAVMIIEDEGTIVVSTRVEENCAVIRIRDSGKGFTFRIRIPLERT